MKCEYCGGSAIELINGLCIDCVADYNNLKMIIERNAPVKKTKKGVLVHNEEE